MEYSKRAMARGIKTPLLKHLNQMNIDLKQFCASNSLNIIAAKNFANGVKAHYPEFEKCLKHIGVPEEVFSKTEELRKNRKKTEKQKAAIYKQFYVAASKRSSER